MSSSSGIIRVFRGCRALFAQANPATPISSTAAAAASPESKPKAPSYGKGCIRKRIPLPPNLKAKVDAAYARIMPISPAFATFLGTPETSRTEGRKKVWDYIKTNRLQNPVNKYEIVCDEKLRKLFGGKEWVTVLEVNKLLAAHFMKSETDR